MKNLILSKKIRFSTSKLITPKVCIMLTSGKILLLAFILFIHKGVVEKRLSLTKKGFPKILMFGKILES